MPSVKKSVFWAAIEQTGPQVISFFTSIILARLLVPEDYGLVGMISIFLAYGRLFADAGMSQALIQRQQVTKDDETSVFILNVGFGLIITLIMCAISPLVALFFKEPKLVNVMCVISLGFIISSFGILQYTLLSKSLAFQKTAFSSLINCIVSGATSITMAMKGFGVWSLICGGLAANISNVICMWIISPWRPRGKFSMVSVRSIWRFSGNLLGAGVYTTFVDNLSNVLIGRSYSANDLGLYTKANQLQLLPVSLLTGIINRVAYPIFSQIQDDKAKLLIQLRKSIRVSLFMTTYICILLMVLADQLIPWLFGSKWNGSIPYLQILSITGIFYPINVLLITSIKSIGRSDLFLKVEIIKKTIIMGALLIACQISIEAMAVSLIFTGAIAYFFNARFTVPLINYKWKFQFVDIFPTWIIFTLSGIIVFVIKDFVFINAVFTMIVRTLIYTITAGIFVWIFRTKYFNDIWEQYIFYKKKVFR